MSGWNFSLTPKHVAPVSTKYRTIRTAIPAPESIELFNQLDKYESTSMHGQMPVIWDKAVGAQVSDCWGNTWIDFTSTIFVANAGHGNPEIVKALQEQIDKPLLHTYSYASKVRVDYLKTLIEASPDNFEKAFLLSAGTEATECGMKLMRMNGHKNGKKRPGIICFEGNWHGRTLGAQMLSYNPAQKAWIGYLDPNIFHLPFPYPWRNIDDPAAFFRDSFKELCEKEGLDPQTDICGFMLETFQGWGAVFYPEEFVREVRKTADSINALLAFDEMQAGFARTGKLFGYMHYNVKADLICGGKGASSSLPLSFVMGSTEVMDLAEIGSMSSTHSANPLCCAAGLANLRYILNNNLCGRSASLGSVFHERLSNIQKAFPETISSVQGVGLLAAVIFKDSSGNPLSELASVICEKAMQKGLLLVHTGRESIKMAPPLVIEEEAMHEGLDVFEESIREALAELT